MRTDPTDFLAAAAAALWLVAPTVTPAQSARSCTNASGATNCTG